MIITVRDNHWINLCLVKARYFALDKRLYRGRRDSKKFKINKDDSVYFSSILLTYKDYDNKHNY